MPETVHFTDGTSAVEYTIQEIKEHAMQRFLEQSVRWRSILRAASEPPLTIVDKRLPKYANSRTPNRYKRL